MAAVTDPSVHLPVAAVTDPAHAQLAAVTDPSVHLPVAAVTDLNVHMPNWQR